MLPEGKHVRAVYNDLLSASVAGKKTTFIDSTTCDVKSSLEVGEKVRASGVGHFFDAPVSGGVNGALNGTLTFMVGAEDVSPIMSVLQMMGKRVFACGGPGKGLAAKLANNYMLALNNISSAEGFILAKKLGLDAGLFSSIVNTSTGRSWSTEANNPVPGVDPNAPSSRDYNNGFGVNLMKKDLLLGLQAAEMFNADVQLGPEAKKIYQILADEGLGSKDMSIVYKYLDH